MEVAATLSRAWRQAKALLRLAIVAQKARKCSGWKASGRAIDFAAGWCAGAALGGAPRRRRIIHDEIKVFAHILFDLPGALEVFLDREGNRPP